MRVLLVGRRFWPHGGFDSAGSLMQLATALKRRAIDVRVLTPRYSSHWPVEFRFGDIPVYRPVLAPRRDWSLGRYTRSLTQWLREHARELDIIFCDSIREEAIAAIEASRGTDCGVVLRASGWGASSDVSWWTTSRSARRCRVIGRLADAVVAPSAACQRSLIAAGYAGQRVHRIVAGFAAGALHTDLARYQARKSLATANADLAAEPEDPVLLCAAPMTRGSGVNELVAAGRALVARFPRLRLWLVGDGPHRDWIYQTLRGEGLRASIAMPGSFCEVDDLLAAADVFFQGDDDGLEFWLPAAIAAEIPVVAIDSREVRTVIGSPPGTADAATTDRLQWCAVGKQGTVTAKSVRIGVTAVLQDLPAARHRATELRRLLLRKRPSSQAVEAYVELFRQLAHAPPGRLPDASIEAIT